MEARVVLVTAPDRDTAIRLARGLVEERLAACVNLQEGVTSIYRWQGVLEESTEVLMVVKTSEGKLAAAQTWLGEHHPYDVPEFVALTPSAVEPKYLAWLLGELA